MVDVPLANKIRFTNTEIYNYLMKLKGFMENNEFGLLTDKRSPKSF